MSVDKSQFDAWRKKMSALGDSAPEVFSDVVVQMAARGASEAKKICTQDSPDAVNTGKYREGFLSEKRSRRSGNVHKASTYNNLGYAQHIEHGFRSHFVPGHWDGKTFVYQPNDPEGGMYVGPPGGFVPGRYTLKRATDRVYRDKAWLERKIDEAIKKRLEGKK